MECSALVDVSSSAVLISHGIIHGWKLTQMAYCSLVSAIPELQDFRSLGKNIFWQNKIFTVDTIIHPTFPNNKNNYCEKKHVGIPLKTFILTVSTQLLPNINILLTTKCRGLF